MFKKSWIGLSLASFLLMSVAGCYGPFKLTKKLHQWNKEVGGPWTQEGVFLVLVIFPVYGFAALGDAVVFNSIEFWTGENPIRTASGRDSGQKVLFHEDRAVRMTRLENGVDLELYQGGERVRHLSLRPGADGSVAALDGKGNVMMTSRTEADGSVLIESARKNLVARYSAEEAAGILDR